MRLLLFIFLLVAAEWSIAQVSTAASVGVVGAFLQGNRASSMAIQFNAAKECFQVQSGLVLFSGIKGVGNFEFVCRTASNIQPVDIRLFPNPVQQYVRLEGNGFSELDQQIWLSVFDAGGKRVWEQTITTYQLEVGVSFFWGWLQAGTYYLQVKSELVSKVIPFIKSN